MRGPSKGSLGLSLVLGFDVTVDDETDPFLVEISRTIGTASRLGHAHDHFDVVRVDSLLEALRVLEHLPQPAGLDAADELGMSAVESEDDVVAAIVVAHRVNLLDDRNDVTCRDRVVGDPFGER